jgi:predicted peptidase
MQHNYTYTLPNVTTEKTYRFFLSTPDNYDPAKECLPLIVFLHGAGERGSDINLVKIHGVPKIFDKANDLRVVTVSPQCELNMVWNSQVYELKAFIDHIVEEYNIDKQRISITGLSMGGFGTWAMGLTFPDYFSALAPVCGGSGMIWLAHLLKDIPIRAFHGTDDTVVLPSGSIEMVNAVNEAGGKAQLTLYDGVGHDSWVQAYEQTDLIKWLAEQVKR